MTLQRCSGSGVEMHAALHFMRSLSQHDTARPPPGLSPSTRTIFQRGARSPSEIRLKSEPVGSKAGE